MDVLDLALPVPANEHSIVFVGALIDEVRMGEG